MACRKPEPTLSKEQFTKAFKKGGWKEVFNQDLSFSNPKSLKNKLRINKLLNTLIKSEIIKGSR